MNSAPTLVVREVQAGVRPVRLRLPFRFGSVTLQACPQLFVRAIVDVNGAPAEGHAAEMLVPKWFDKREGFSHVDNVRHLLDSLSRAQAAYTGDSPAHAFGLFERHHAALMRAGDAAGATALSAAYGAAVLDRAVLDALCHATGLSFFDAVRSNAVGLADSPLLPDLRGLDWPAWLNSLQPLPQVAARHTVGMLDPLEPASTDAEGDLPVSLPGVIALHGHRYFKVKLGGQPEADVQRLAEVLAVLDAHAGGHRFTLDGNEQYASVDALTELFGRLRHLPALRHRPEALLYIEQPVPRNRSLHDALPWRAAPAPLLMDEADGSLDAFPQGLALGWHGVSSKACKGLYKALANRARCDRHNAAAARDGQPPRAFMSAEDLTCQAGLSVQQDLALASLLGLGHCERNGHHYGSGFGTAPASEQAAFCAAQASLYAGNPPRLRIVGGWLDIGSLFAPGFAHRADPDWGAIQPLAQAASML